MRTLDKILKIDRRWIFLLVAVSVAIPLLTPLKFVIEETPPVRNVFEKIDSLPEGANVMISFDYGPGSAPELSPMALAIIRHCFVKNLRVISLTLGADGAALGEQIMNDVVAEMNIIRDESGLPELQKGTDYIYLGFKAGYALVIISLVETFTGTFPSDYNGSPTNQQPIFKNLRDLGDLDLLIPLASSATPETWIAYGKERAKFDMAVGCTAVSATQYYPYLNSGQLLGLLGGLKGAAEYETMIVDEGIYPDLGFASKGMAAQSIVHLMVVLMVIFANTIYIINRRRNPGL